MIQSKIVSEAILVAESCSPDEISQLIRLLLGDKLEDFRESSLTERTKASIARFLRGRAAEDIKDVLLSVLMTHERSCANTVKPVFTAPKKYRPSQRSTKDEMMDLISSAKQSIYIFGFWFTESVKPIVDALCSASDRGVKIIIIADSIDNFIQPLKGCWVSKNQPSMYIIRKQAAFSMDTKMHAKTIVVDEKRMLITSANLTYLGLNENLELGVVIEDRSATTKICEFISQVIHDSEYFEKVK